MFMYMATLILNFEFFFEDCLKKALLVGKKAWNLYPVLSPMLRASLRNQIALFTSLQMILGCKQLLQESTHKMILLHIVVKREDQFQLL